MLEYFPRTLLCKKLFSNSILSPFLFIIAKELDKTKLETVTTEIQLSDALNFSNEILDGIYVGDIVAGNDLDFLTKHNIKYVVNSVLSAVDLNKLEDTDKEEIIGKIEGGESEEGMDMSEPAMEPSTDEVPTDLGSDGSDEISTQPEVGEARQPHSKFLDELFTESKVDKILSKYFVITEEEKKQNEKKQVTSFIKKKINKVGVVDEIKKLSETIEQELTAEFILSENENVKFVGKTNLKNLVFENEGKQIKVSPKGEIL